MFVGAFLVRPATPRLVGDGRGDSSLCALIEDAKPTGHDLTVVLLQDTSGSVSSRTCTWASDVDRPYEIGSISKAMTGMLIADAVQRGEISLDDPLGKYLPLGDSPAANITFREVVTHSSGLPRDVGVTFADHLWFVLHGSNPFHRNVDEVVSAAAGSSLGPREFAYSNAGAALAGQALAAAAHMSFTTLIDQRLFEPLGMRASGFPPAVTAPAGRSTAGFSMAPWVVGGYDPTGGVVSNAPDMTRFATALLEGTAPGMSALTPLAHAGGGQIGYLWLIGDVGGRSDDAKLQWHNGQTGGYASYLGIDPTTHRAVIVLSDTAASVDDLALRVLKEG